MAPPQPLARFFKPNITRADVQIAWIIALSCGIAALFDTLWPSPQGLWAVIITFFLPYAKVGARPIDRHLNLLLIGSIATVAIVLTSLIPAKLPLISLWLFLATLVLYILPRYLPGCQLAMAFVLALVVLAYNFPTHSWQELHERIVAVIVGVAIMLPINVIFDRHTINAPPQVDRSLYLLQRAMRTAIGLVIALYICQSAGIRNFAWVAISLIVIDQNSLGATFKKAGKRVVGTFLGIAIGIVIAHYMASNAFTHAISLVLVFAMYCVIRQYYGLGICIATILLCNLFSLLFPQYGNLFTFGISRLADTALGIVIGLASAMVIFPRSSFSMMRADIGKFWQVIIQILERMQHSHLEQVTPAELHALIKQLEQNIKDFRYEPLSLFFRRYQLCLQLVPLMNRLVATLIIFPDIRKNCAEQNFQNTILQPMKEVVVLINSTHLRPNENAVEPLRRMQQQLSDTLQSLADNPSAKKVIILLKVLVRHYEKMTLTPRWRLEIN